MNTIEIAKPDLLTRIEADVAALPERLDVTPDEACQLIDGIDGAMKRLRSAKAELETFLIGWLPTTPERELRIGDVKYYVAPNKKTKCPNIPAAVTAIYEAVGGDFDAFCDVLSTGALKPGAAKKVLGDRFAELFEVTEEMDLETKRPKPALQSINERFIR